MNNSPNQYIVCSHDWTFLEGEKKHNHTLKAGRHLFPFELRLGGSLPSSIATYVNGGASISYKLRATAIRSGFSTNLTAILPITIIRTFAPESLEYQQTLEIENTWPDKVMYALMIPHKAWAAGDEVTALVKFAPLQKGVRVLTITTHLCETTKTLARGGHIEKTRNVVTRKHEIINGRAVSVEDQQRKRLHNALRETLGQNVVTSGASSPGYMSGASAFVSGTSTPVVETGLALSRFETNNSSGSGSSASSGDQQQQPPEITENDDSEVTTTLSIPLPPSLTPSHSLDPIIVSYRIRWSVLLGNLDGHTSELRCSLPIHILDYTLLDEARTATRATRRLLFGGEDAPRDPEEEDAQLPSYPSHVRDRVALDVSSVPDMAAMSSGSVTPAVEQALGDFPGFSVPSSGGVQSVYESSPISMGSPVQQLQQLQQPLSRMGTTPPETSSAESSRPNTRPSSRHGRDGSSGWGPFSLSRRNSRSRLHSRANSRAASPERGAGGGNVEGSSQQQIHHGHSMSGSSAPGVARADDTHIHTAHAASRHQHGLFSVMMKPLSTFSSPWHSASHANALAQHFQNTYSRPPASSHGGSFGGGIVSSVSSGDLRGLLGNQQQGGGLYGSGNSLGHGSLGNSFGFSRIATPFENQTPVLNTSASTSAVPDYFTAAHGSTSVPPLESLRGLPTYEDSEAQVAENRQGQSQALPVSTTPGSGAGGQDMREAEPQRSFSDSDLVSLFNRAREGPRVR